MSKNRLQTFTQSLNENYPPGAANDPRAPFNQIDPNFEYEEFDGSVCDEDNNDLPVHVKYKFYYTEPGSERKQIDPNFEVSFKNPGDEAKADKNALDSDIRQQIEDHAGKWYDWAE